MDKKRSMMAGKIKFFIFILAFISNSNFIFAEQISSGNVQFSSTLEVMDFVMHYYQDPDIKKLLLALKFMLNERRFWDQPQAGANSFMHFVATALQEEKDQLNNLKMLIKGSDDIQSAILNRIIYETENYKIVYPTDAASFDLIWAEFFATGKADPVLRLIDVLEWRIDKDDPFSYADLSVVIWSLSSNIEQHSRVKEICEGELKNRRGLAKERLHKALSYPAKEIWENYIKELNKIADRYKKKHKNN